MSTFPDTADDPTNWGYNVIDNANKSGNDLVTMRYNNSTPLTEQDCMAACNAADACKSVAFLKGGAQCWLKTHVQTDGYTSDANMKMLYKPSTQPKLYVTNRAITNGKGIVSSDLNNTLPNGTGDWNTMYGIVRDSGTCGSTKTESCPNNMFEMGGRAIVDCGSVTPRYGRTCGAPPQKRVCPNIGVAPDGSDIRYVRHENITSGYNYNQSDANWGGAAREQDWYRGAGIRCGYHRIDKRYWALLPQMFDTETRKNIIKDHCFGPGVTSVELFEDNACTTYLTQGGSDGLNLGKERKEMMLEKMAAEGGQWWNDTRKIQIIQEFIQESGLGVDRTKLLPLINSLDTSSSTTWTSSLISILNRIMNTEGMPSAITDAITTKIKTYCDSKSDGGLSDQACACKNATDGWGTKDCKQSTKGCDDVAAWISVRNQLQEAGLANRPEFIYFNTNFNASRDSKACENSRTSGDTLSYGPKIQGDTKILQFCGLINSASDEGKITYKGDVNFTCSQTATSSTEINNKTTNSDESNTGDGGDGGEVGGSNTWLIIGIVVSCVVMMLILALGGGLILFI